MPTPLPLPGEEHLEPPDAAEHEFVARGLATAAAPRSGLTDLQADLLRSIIMSMTGFERDVRHLMPVSPMEFAEGLRHRNYTVRVRLIHHMALAEMILEPPDEDVRTQVDAFAHELSIDSACLRALRTAQPSAATIVALDIDRNCYLQRIEAQGALDFVAASHRHLTLDKAWTTSVVDPDLARRWDSLAQLPPHTLGRLVHDMYRARGFIVPGRPGSAPPLVAQHDWVHVLANYGTSVQSELEVFAFIARASDDPSAFALLAMVINLFETGRLPRAAGLFEASPGHLAKPGMCPRLADALYRGAATPGSHDFLSFDWFSVADWPLDELRSDLAIPPKSPGAVEAGSRGPFEPGGITHTQQVAGRRLRSSPPAAVPANVSTQSHRKAR